MDSGAILLEFVSQLHRLFSLVALGKLRNLAVFQLTYVWNGDNHSTDFVDIYED